MNKLGEIFNVAFVVVFYMISVLVVGNMITGSYIASLLSVPVLDVYKRQVLLALTEIYQKKSKFHKKNKKKRWYKIVSWAITMNFVLFGFLIFSGHII